MAVLELDAVVGGYADTQILHGVSIAVGAGEIVEVEVLSNSSMVGRPLAELRPRRLHLRPLNQPPGSGGSEGPGSSDRG